MASTLGDPTHLRRSRRLAGVAPEDEPLSSLTLRLAAARRAREHARERIVRRSRMAIAVPSLGATLVYVVLALVIHSRGADSHVHAVPVPASQLRPTAPHPLVVTTRRVVGTVMSAVAGNDAGLSDVRHYAGGMYGVSATVKLDFAERRADVELWGVPIAGRVAGYGWLSATGDAQESGAVVLDDALQAKLDRRMVRVVNAALDRQADSVTVRVVVPILGEQELVLARTAAPKA